MNEELQIKVQAFLDGELSEAEAREISSLIASDADVAALHKELKQTRAALAGFEKRIVLPETREFYWSKIAREIERTEAAQERPTAEPVSIFHWLRRALVPAMGLAVLAVAMFFTLRPGRPAIAPAAGGMEVASVDSSAMTYRNYESGATLVWLSYPAENGLAQDNPAGSIN
jgi:anti-sigma factor RsiW